MGICWTENHVIFLILSDIEELVFKIYDFQFLTLQRQPLLGHIMQFVGTYG